MEATPWTFSLRLLIAAISFVVMFTPDMWISASVAAVVVLTFVIGVYQHIQLAPKTYTLGGAEIDALPQGDLSPVLAGAKRDIG